MSAPGVLLANLGTPDRPEPHAVARYLREFLMDRRVIDLPYPFRWFLVNLLIVPRRARASAEAYRSIWSDEGSPLLVHGLRLRDAVRERLPDRPVALGMRYGNPSLVTALRELTEAGAKRVRLVPLFPQYAEATSGSLEEGAEWAACRFGCELLVAPPYPLHPGFIRAQAEVARPLIDDLSPDAFVMSFHGLPERQVRKADRAGLCLREGCCDRLEDRNALCYRAHAFATARALGHALGLPKGSWQVTFQSRLGRTRWIGPYTDETVVRLATSGIRRILVLSPSFVADCLETLEELGIRLRESFLGAGGERLEVAPCVNEHPVWIDAVVDMATANDQSPRPMASS